jgi:putative heme-binding domain-containing protein
MSRKSSYSLLHEILDPNAAADTRYLSHRLETSRGEVLIGIIAAEDDESLHLKMMGGLERSIPRREIKRLESTGLSLMPEGLEAGMEAQHLADLIAYLQQPGE